MIRRIAVAASLASAAMVPPAAAQFSSDIPGVPRAAISVRGGHQNRTEWTFSGYRVPSSGTINPGDSLAGGLRVGFGTSYRIFSQFEIGYDFTLLDAYGMQTPAIKNTAGATIGSAPLYLRGLTAYDIRVGGKYRPVVALDPDGYGYEIAFGASIQPELKPLYGVEHLGDSTRQGGQFASDDKKPPSTYFKTNPFAKLSSTTDLAAMASYRSRRILADAAIVAEKVGDRDPTLGESPLTKYDGVSFRAGGVYRIWPSVAAGVAYWGQGAPPWRDDVKFQVPGTPSLPQYGILLQFGSEPEAGIDLMYTSPNGNYAQSGRLYIRARSTR